MSAMSSASATIAATSALTLAQALPNRCIQAKGRLTPVHHGGLLSAGPAMIGGSPGYGSSVPPHEASVNPLSLLTQLTEP